MYKINSILFILTALLFINNGYAQCDGGTAIAAQPTVCSGSSNTITVSVPSGTVQWQESSDGTNWFDVTQGSTSINTTSNTISTTFSYTGSPQNFIVPNGVTTINADGMGAAGGHGSSDFNGRGGLGGRLISDIATTPGETLSVTIGEKGHNTTVNPGTGQQANNLWVAGDALGGFNGGGNGSNGSGGGGGATDIRQGGNALSNRIFVVGSGGGGGNQRRNTEAGGNGGNGGGNTAANGTNGAAGGAGGGGGSQVVGGSSSGNNGATNGSQGQGGTGATSGRQGGGGGGGYYGGGGGGFVNDKAGGGGGGGSSYSSGSITTNTQGNSSASGNGTLSLSYTMPVVTSVYTTPGLTSSTYYRAVVTDGLCNDISTTETVLITPDNTATLSSAVATTSQTINLGASLTSITYTTAGATGATFSGLPSGVSGAWNANMITISGVPTVAGIFNYTATLTGGCGTISASGSIKVLNNPNLNNFSAEVKTFFDQSYTITPPATTGSGTITYTSSDLAVATISGTTVTIVGAGTTTITATQVSDGIYYSDSISANLTVNNVTALTKNGKESNSDLNYINKNGAVKTDTTLTKHGEIIPAKSQ